MAWTAFALTVYAGVTMVSNAPFWSGKALAIKQSVPFWALGVVALIFVAVSSDPPLVLFGLFVIYGISGYALWAWRMIKRPKIV
jgi:CDP-diacylglycerol--serine O-phosphatidyltransferase